MEYRNMVIFLRYSFCIGLILTINVNTLQLVEDRQIIPRCARLIDLGQISNLCVEVFFGEDIASGQKIISSSNQRFNEKQRVHRDLRKRIDSDFTAYFVVDDKALFQQVQSKRQKIKSNIVGFVELSLHHTNYFGDDKIECFPLNVSKLHILPKISALAVDPRYRKLGIGASLVQACIDQAQAWNYPSIFLEVEKSNSNLFRFYTNIGFYRVARQNVRGSSVEFHLNINRSPT